MNHSNDCRIHDDASVCDCGVLAARDAGLVREPQVMAAAAPKDNEVDEKVIEPVAVIYPDSGLRNDAAAMALWRNYGYDTGGEPLYSAATVAELRADVERLRDALDSCREAGNKHVRRRCQMDDEIDRLTAEKTAAERRVGELEAEMTKLRDEWQASLGWKGAVVHGTRENIGVIADALTGADPT